MIQLAFLFLVLILLVFQMHGRQETFRRTLRSSVSEIFWLSANPRSAVRLIKLSELCWYFGIRYGGDTRVL